MTRPNIKRNRIRCIHCGDTIESKHRHDFVTCECGKVSVDGGKDYLRRVGDIHGYDDLSEMYPECKATHDGKHRPIKKLGSKTGWICKGCGKEIEVKTEND